MNLNKYLNTNKGAQIELILFCLLSLSTLSMFVVAPFLYGIAITSIIARNIEWSEIGFNFRDFTLKKIAIGIGLAFLYHFADTYLIEPAISKFSNASLPAVFDMKGNIYKLIFGIIISWTAAAFFEELLFRGYLINRLIDVFGENKLTKGILVLISGIIFGFAHYYQGLNGAIAAGAIGIFQSTVFLLDDKKLTIPVITHGVFDTIGFSLLFIG